MRFANCDRCVYPISMNIHPMFGLVACFTVSAYAQQVKVVSFPQVGAETTIPAGGEVYSYLSVYTIDGARIDADTKAGDWLLEQPVASGTQLVPVKTKTKFKGCVPLANTFEPAGPCFLDDDGDGRFDRHASDDSKRALKLKRPVPYTKMPISIVRADSFMRVILYQGATTDTLRFSYREFKDDMARAAFTEELTIPREAFPFMMRVKNLQIQVSAVSGMGLRYKLVRVD
jgi:hypothetical protein